MTADGCAGLPLQWGGAAMHIPVTENKHSPECKECPDGCGLGVVHASVPCTNHQGITNTQKQHFGHRHSSKPCINSGVHVSKSPAHTHCLPPRDALCRSSQGGGALTSKINKKHRSCDLHQEIKQTVSALACEGELSMTFIAVCLPANPRSGPKEPGHHHHHTIH